MSSTPLILQRARNPFNYGGLPTDSKIASMVDAANWTDYLKLEDLGLGQDENGDADPWLEKWRLSPLALTLVWTMRVLIQIQVDSKWAWAHDELERAGLGEELRFVRGTIARIRRKEYRFLEQAGSGLQYHLLDIWSPVYKPGHGLIWPPHLTKARILELKDRSQLNELVVEQIRDPIPASAALHHQALELHYRA